MQLPYYQRAYSVKYDLTNCEEEPLHIIQYLQSHAVLLACDKKEMVVTNTTENAPNLIGWEAEKLIGTHLEELFPAEIVDRILGAEELKKINPIKVNFGTRTLNAIAHVQEDLLLIEIEPRDEKVSSVQFLHLIDEAIREVQQTDQIQELLKVAAREVRKLTQFDRVMVYQFDESYNGDVVAEEIALNKDIEPYLGLHYPMTDIPKQARDLYLKNRVRIIADVKSEPARILPSTHPTTGQPLDLTKSVARGVSPVHLEYLGNMGVHASMSIAIVVDESLWGLIACHHYEPKLIDYRIRDIVRFLGQIISGHLSLQAAQIFRRSALNSNIIKAQLVEQMNKDWSLTKGLIKGKVKLTDLNSSSEAAIFIEGKLHRIGKTITTKQLLNLIKWLNEQDFDHYFQTNELPQHYPKAKSFLGKVVGVLAVRIAKGTNDYVLWFKPEIAQTVTWGGKPDKVLEQTEAGMRMTPRKSFAKWEQQVEGRSQSWEEYEVQSALALRADIKDFIFERYREVKQLNKELTSAYQELEQFSYSISHDLRAPLRSIDGFAEILAEDYEDQLDDYGKSLIEIIKISAQKMNLFIDDLLRLAKLGKNDLLLNEIDIIPIIQEIEKTLRVGEATNRTIELDIVEPLPKVLADRTLMYQLFQNLLSNAFKYTRREAVAKIKIEGEIGNSHLIYHISDNGIGFDQIHAEKAFEVFSRLVPEDEFEGTGIGLAIVAKIMQQHQGKIEVISEMGKGSKFSLFFPKISSVHTKK